MLKPRVERTIPIEKPSDSYFTRLASGDLYFRRGVKDPFTTHVSRFVGGEAFTRSILEKSGVCHNFTPFRANGSFYALGGVDFWTFNKVYDRNSYENTIKNLQAKYGPLFSDLTLFEYRRIRKFTKHPPLPNTGGLYLMRSSDGVLWTFANHGLPILYPFDIMSSPTWKVGNFDGTPSIVHHDGSFHLYLRANLQKGVRYIQHATSFNLIDWSSFLLIDTEFLPRKDEYYTCNFQQYRNKILAFLPYYNKVTLKHSIRIFVSQNGHQFRLVHETLKRKLKTARNRSFFHPVQGFWINGVRLHFMVHHNYRHLYRIEPTFLREYSFNREELDELL